MKNAGKMFCKSQWWEEGEKNLPTQSKDSVSYNMADQCPLHCLVFYLYASSVSDCTQTCNANTFLLQHDIEAQGLHPLD